MNQHLIVSTPRPSCILPVGHQARAHIGSDHTNVRATWEPHKAPVKTGNLKQNGAGK